MYKLSVITPIYNTEKYLDKCLHSLVSQTLQDIELVWIANGCSAECKEIIERYKKQYKNIKVIDLKENVGFAAALALGIQNSSGEYIGFCDSDDWVDNSYYQELYETAKKNDADIIYAEYELEYPNKSELIKHSNYCKEKTLSKKLDILKNGALWNKLFKKSVLSRVQNFSSFKHSYFLDNVFLMYGIFASDLLMTVNIKGYHYRQVQTSTIHDKKSKKARQTGAFEVIAYIINMSKDYALTKEEKDSLFSFFARSFNLKSLIKNKSAYDVFYQNLLNDDCWKKRFSLFQKVYNPCFIKKVFSFGFYNKELIFWFLGKRLRVRNK